MRQKYNTYLFCNDDGDSLKLEQAPVNWDSIKFSLIRDLVYLGVLKSISVEFEFIAEAYRFLQAKRLLYGMDMDIIVRVYINNPNTWLFDGKLNQENFAEDRKLRKYRVDVVQSSFVQNFQNREDVEINVLNNIGLDRQSVIPAALQNCLFRGKQIEFYSEFTGAGDSFELYSHTLPFLNKVNGNTGVNTSAYAISISPDTTEQLHEELYNRDSAIYTNNLPTDQSIDLDLDTNFSINYLGEPLQILLFAFDDDFVIRGGHREVYRLVVIDQDGVETQILSTIQFTDVSGNFSWNYVGTVVVPPGHSVVVANERHLIRYQYEDGDLEHTVDTGFMYDFGDDGPLSETRLRTEITYNVLNLKINTASNVPDTVNPVILPHELFSNIIAQINGGTLYSEVFGRIDLGYYNDGLFAYLGITKGELLRGIDPAKVQVATSMREAFKSYSSVICLGAIITEQQIRIDPLDILFNNNIATDLGEVEELIISPAKEFLFNSVKAGYPKNEYEQENGRDEINTEYQYTNSFKSVKKELDLVSKYYGDGYGIEFARRASILNTGTADSRYDDLIFFVDMIKVDGVLQTRRLEGILHLSGVFSPETMINARIAVGQNMLRWKKYLNIPLHKKDKVYYFQSKDKNASLNLVTSLGTTIDGQDLNTGNQAIFLPDKAGFKVPITIQTLFEILANPLGIMKFTYEKESFFNFLMEVDSETDKNMSQWRTLATRDSPVQIVEAEEGNALMHDDGLTDYVGHESAEEDIVLYE